MKPSVRSILLISSLSILPSLMAQEPIIIYPPPPLPCTPDTSQSGPGPKSCTPCCKENQALPTIKSDSVGPAKTIATSTAPKQAPFEVASVIWGDPPPLNPGPSKPQPCTPDTTQQGTSPSCSPCCKQTQRKASFVRDKGV